ncbi:hypothetical protein FQA39_LY12964 [Lamprigera yunnana]|nr:hypothetical protein FQA39_LY12964 [Lamprigera yunnana]
MSGFYHSFKLKKFHFVLQSAEHANVTINPGKKINRSINTLDFEKFIPVIFIQFEQIELYGLENHPENTQKAIPTTYDIYDNKNAQPLIVDESPVIGVGSSCGAYISCNVIICGIKNVAAISSNKITTGIIQT